MRVGSGEHDVSVKPEELRAAEDLRPLSRRLRALGVANVGDLEAILKLVKVQRGIARGDNIVRSPHSLRHSTMLLDGLACMSSRLQDGGRQICTFYYPGDFVALSRYIFPHSTEHIEVEALTNCSIGTVDNDALERLLALHPALALALWRATMIETSILRQQLVTMRRPALQRVAHLLCEQLTRRASLGISKELIPLNQIEVADAAAVSVVHTNRIFQRLRKLGVLSKNRHAVEVVDKKRLVDLAGFDSRYLNIREALSQWDVRIEDKAKPRIHLDVR
jgi:CRP-like cAMP-binding protein